VKRAIPLGAATVLIGALGVTLPTVTTAATAASGGTRQIPSAGTTSIRAGALGPEGLQQPEVRPIQREEESSVADHDHSLAKANRGPFPRHPLPAPTVRSSALAPTNPGQLASVDGITHRDQRLANGGNQFSLEPPDQGLCVGNGFVVEAVNSAIQVRGSRHGGALTGVEDLNTFFGYPAAIDRTTGVVGPNVIDPVCLYDRSVNRFVVAITTLDVEDNGDFNGKNTIDVAVSNTGDPRGAWTIYHVPAQNDGTDGTPNHGCTTDGSTPGPCFQDYPHIGADANGVYITTNEYDLFGPSYNAAQVFAFSKWQLATHPSSVRMTLVENLHVAGTPGWTAWPASSPAGEFSGAAHGTEFMLSTITGDGSETGNPTGTADKIGVWALTNTSSLRSTTPDLRVSSRLTRSETYVVPPLQNQKKGPIPLAQCLNDTTMATPFGPGCWQAFFAPDEEPAHNEVESTPDANDGRMQQTWYVNGTLWGSADTAVRVGGKVKAGIAWFAVRPGVDRSGNVQGRVTRQGYLALRDNNLSYPAIALTKQGQGAIAFSVMGKDFYPSAGYVRIDERGHVGPVHIAARGLGPDDGFTSYKAFVGDPPRTRWGDYGAAVVDGSSIWLASEYIGQRCTLAEYFPNPDLTDFGSCNNTRTSLANWYTRITKLR